MKRVIIGAFFGATFFLCSHRAASAMAEFCPATLNYQRAGANQPLIGQEQAPTPEPPASLYGFELSALSTRTITNATLAFDTTGGWFTVNVPSIVLTEKDRHYTGPSSTFVRRDYVSPIMYARFPSAVSVNHAWLYSASVTGDGDFGWHTKGVVQCDPPPAASEHQAAYGDFHKAYKLDPKDEDRADTPSATSLVLASTPSNPLETAACADPFSYATTRRIAQPQFPSAMRGVLSGRATTSVEVAINADGSLADAWIWGPSGFTPFDDEALRAARNTTYNGARSYCRAVPGIYLFRVTFAPN